MTTDVAVAIVLGTPANCAKTGEQIEVSFGTGQTGRQTDGRTDGHPTVTCTLAAYSKPAAVMRVRVCVSSLTTAHR